MGFKCSIPGGYILIYWFEYVRINFDMVILHDVEQLEVRSSGIPVECLVLEDVKKIIAKVWPKYDKTMNELRTLTTGMF